MDKLPGSSISLAGIQFAFEHVFLPPKLPQTGDDPEAAAHETSLLATVSDALQLFFANVQPEHKSAVDAAIYAIHRLRCITRSDGSVDEEHLLEALHGLGKTDDLLPIYVKAQNAGIIVTRKQDSVVFEPFELSPRNNSAIQTVGRLQRRFPASSVALDVAKFRDSQFQREFVHSITKMSHQEVAKMKASVKKAGDKHIEERDTTAPEVVTNLLATVLRTLGDLVEEPRIWKNTREEALLCSDAHLPWRRSSLWLFVRITLQLCMSRMAPNVTLYKEFMVVLMAGILRSDKSHQLPSDMLYCMIAKISRRLLKLNQQGRTYQWLPMVEETLARTRSCVQNRWEDILRETATCSDMQPLSTQEFHQGTRASYPGLDDFFIRGIPSQRLDGTVNCFVPTQISFKVDQKTLPCLQSSSGDDTRFHLLVFESWVEMHLNAWLTTSIAQQATCKLLYRALKTYHGLASAHYAENPEALSIMVLTIMELWVAADQSACWHHSLMLAYDPEIPLELLQSLILPSRGQMERLQEVEEHVKARRDGARYRTTSIYHSFGEVQSFSVKYFEYSPRHQQLFQMIETEAHSEREAKIAEFRKLQAEYRRLMASVQASSCIYDYYVDPRTGVSGSSHRTPCRRCIDRSTAESLQIFVHEWPLPANRYRAQSAVFELEVPIPFGNWRNISTYCRINVLQSQYEIMENTITSWDLEGYLLPWYNSEDSRVKVVSITKPNRGTHRNIKPIATAAENEVLVANGMTYRYCDQSIVMSAAETRDTIPNMLTYKLSNQHASLQNFLLRPFHQPSGLPPNEVISRQAACPDDLALEEFKAMATVPVGYRIQWLNILTNLHVPSLDFKKLDTILVLLQSSFQAGPPLKDTAYRAGHQPLGDDVFAGQLLKGLRLAVSRIRENWESCYALSAFISLAARLHTLSPSVSVSEECLSFLADCRQVALKWLRDLQHKSKQSDNDKQRAQFLERVFQVAHVCISSFDVDYDELRNVLASPAEASVMIESAMAIQCTTQCVQQLEDDFNRLSMHRWRRLMYRCKAFLLEEILQRHSPCLDNAIRITWSAYGGRGQAWSLPSGETDDWLVTRTTSTGSLSLAVQFNLLTAELLVNGRPLSRLPTKFEGHPCYETLFGKAMVEVMPTDLPGMQFSAKKSYNGYTVHLGMSENDILVMAIKEGDTMSLIPSRLFGKSLPYDFVHKYVHWYHQETQTIEFRPKATPWKPLPDSWELRKTDSVWVMQRGSHESLFSPASSAAKRLLNLLAPVESSLNIHVTHNSRTGQVGIELPRLQLKFFLKPGSSIIQCRQFRGMYVDPVQGIDTLVGLTSKLVLRNHQGQRKVLLPNGTVKWAASQDHHIKVTIDKGTSNKAHPYDIDTSLGRLVDNGDLQSKLILCYLHAMTSYCLADPLTGRTGTEESLTILNSAAVRSFKWLSRDNLQLLDVIAKLSPGRSYYPPNERVLERIVWNDGLSFLSQHGHFYQSVRNILVQAERSKVFYQENYIKPKALDFVDPTLHQRHLIRASVFQLDGFGAEDHTTTEDRCYEARDTLGSLQASARAFKVATSIYQGRGTLYEQVSHKLQDEIWNCLSLAEVTGIGKLELQFESLITYDAQWLGNFRTLMSSYWCQLHQILCGSHLRPNKFRLLLCLAAMAYSEDCNPQALQTLVVCANSAGVGMSSLPGGNSFDLQQGRKVDAGRIRGLVAKHLVPYHNCPEATLLAHDGETHKKLRKRRERTFNANRSTAMDQFTAALVNQWPCENPCAPSGDGIQTYIESSSAMASVLALWRHWFRNLQFYNYLEQISNAIRKHSMEPIPIPGALVEKAPPSKAQQVCAFVPEKDLFLGNVVPLPISDDDSINILSPALGGMSEGGSLGSGHLSALIQRLRGGATHEHELEYARDLERSVESLTNMKPQPSLKCLDDKVLRGTLRQNLDRCRDHVEMVYETLKEAAKLDNPGSSATAQTLQLSSRQIGAEFMAPRISPKLFLRQLVYKRWRALPRHWKRAISAYGLALSRRQRAERMSSLSDNLDHNKSDILKELLNPGHTNWDPLDYPESLLMEVESGITIRENQESIAADMRAPPNNRNATMQLNMGEGKSSVIAPIVAAHLADGTRLVRVIVAKPQAKELYRTLVARLGGLLDHRIFHMPFSRSLKPKACDIRAVRDIAIECKEKGGVLLMQPEHILSYQLMGIECCLSGVDDDILGNQHFFDVHTRDIVDESDENFNVKFELVYTMGTQRPVELSPERWVLTQRVLDLVAQKAHTVQEKFTESVEVTYYDRGRFPRIRILRQDATNFLLDTLAQELCGAGLPGFPIARQSREVRKDVLSYISIASLSIEQVSAVEEESGFYTEATKGPLLLLRGLIAGGVLEFALGQKRWRVNYGLTSNRNPKTRLAVPYRAKDSPTPRSEFSHPDVVIVLTCLSYYYGGLSDDDLFLSFDHLLQSDQADNEYQGWVRDAPMLPESFHRLEGVNIRDCYQMKEHILPNLRFAKSVIDYFLTHFVFSKEMREFPQKLSASGWDIGRQKVHPTTGFSGTNDSRHMLPLDVQHLDLEEQKHTNALVLGHLLQPENTIAYIPRRKGSASDAEVLLNVIQSLDPLVQVILDVGAQILELTNIQVARTWLERTSAEQNKEAAIFFDDSDDLCVIDRHGQVEQLQTSPYAQQLDVCLVFLDEAHTRGTDLRLPLDYRAAVTLGANLTKDKLVQACMRMRRLGQGQSVVFCVSEEIQAKIHAICHKPSDAKFGDATITVYDVLLWSISESHADIRRGLPLWALQGVRFERQSDIWEQTETNSATGIKMTLKLAEAFLEDEAQTLEYRYRPRNAGTKSDGPLNMLSSPHTPKLLKIKQRCKEFNCLDYKSSALLEEQERELAPEIEQEKQVERPPEADPEEHRIHPHVRHFIATGEIPVSSPAFITAFKTLGNTSAAEHLDVCEFPDGLWTTVDYMRTVKPTGGRHCADSYQRPIQWILSNASVGGRVKKLVIISPYEAEGLLPEMEKSRNVVLHLYAPRPNLAFPALDDLKLYTIPRLRADWELPISLKQLLNLFSGQIYFTTMADYKETCEMLGLAWHPTIEGMTVQADGFISHAKHGSRRQLTKSPVKFLMVLLTRIRRGCRSIDKSHWGRILGGGLLRESDFAEPGDETS
ncbi:hypothetical protein CDD83_7603 [Cordyceps sp. RAO-2017]|nr:hypothetical protein CDD83_7603 [Cordyceps sp. RAO-2017]